MTKLKTFFQNKRNIVISLIIALSIVAISLTIIFYNKNKPVKTVQVVSEQTSSEETSSTVINVPPIVVDKSVSSSLSSTVLSDVSSKEVTLKVDGNPSSKAVSSNPQVKVESKVENKPVSSKPTQSKPKPPVSSKPVTPPPASSEPTEPIEPPYNPDGPQHGEKITDEDGTFYFHVGIDSYIDDYFWTNLHFGEHSDAKKSDLDTNMYKYIKHGEQLGNVVWCSICNDFIKVEYWNDGRHAKAAH